MNQQLLLELGVSEATSFANFCSGPNAEVVSALESVGVGTRIYLHGAGASGKSHLLQSVCHAVGRMGQRAIYLPLRGIADPAAIVGVEDLFAVCIDDIDVIAGSREWETALYDIVNQCVVQQAALVIAGKHSPDALDLVLPDLCSRLKGMAVMHLQTPDDDDKARILRRYAQQRGMDLSPDAAAYLLTHGPRALEDLLAQMEVLDVATLSELRKPTVPFIRQTLFPEA